MSSRIEPAPRDRWSWRTPPSRSGHRAPLALRHSLAIAHSAYSLFWQHRTMIAWEDLTPEERVVLEECSED